MGDGFVWFLRGWVVVFRGAWCLVFLGRLMVGFWEMGGFFGWDIISVDCVCY